MSQVGDLSDKVIITCSLPMDAGNTRLVVGHTSSGAEELSNKAKRAKVASAFNTVIFPGLLQTVARRIASYSARPYKKH